MGVTASQQPMNQGSIMKKRIRKDPAKGHAGMKRKREKLRYSTKIPYPNKVTECDIVCYLVKNLRFKGVDARTEVWAEDKTSRFDIVIFKDRNPIRILEVKSSKKKRTTPQRRKYSKYEIPLHFIKGLKEAKEFVQNAIVKNRYQFW